MAPIGIRPVRSFMKITHAINFFLVGFAMCFSPAYWPNHFAEGGSGNENSELWLMMMGAAQMAMGAWTMGLNVVPRLTHFLAEWEPITLKFDLPDVSWALPDSFYSGLNEDDDISLARTLQQQLRLSQA